MSYAYKGICTCGRTDLRYSHRQEVKLVTLAMVVPISLGRVMWWLLRWDRSTHWPLKTGLFTAVAW
jgi:hypothetical protein